MQLSSALTLVTLHLFALHLARSVPSPGPPCARFPARVSYASVVARRWLSCRRWWQLLISRLAPSGLPALSLSQLLRLAPPLSLPCALVLGCRFYLPTGPLAFPPLPGAGGSLSEFALPRLCVVFAPSAVPRCASTSATSGVCWPLACACRPPFFCPPPLPNLVAACGCRDRSTCSYARLPGARSPAPLLPPSLERCSCLHPCLSISFLTLSRRCVPGSCFRCTI